MYNNNNIKYINNINSKVIILDYHRHYGLSGNYYKGDYFSAYRSAS